MKKKIAMIFPKDSEAMFNKNSTRTFGGATVQMYLIAKELKNHKEIEIYSLIPNYKKIDFKDKDKFNLVKTFDEEDSLLKKIWKFHKKIQEVKPDVIIQRGLTLFSCLLAKYCKLKSINFVFMFASDIEVNGKFQNSGKKCMAFKMLLKNSHLVISQNFYQQEVLRRLGVKSKIIHNGMYPKKRKVNEGKYILWVGRCDKVKKPEKFLELVKSFPQKNFVIICPKSKDETYFESIYNHSKEIKNLKFINYVRNIQNYYSKAQVLVNTSDYEGFPQTFVESSACGTLIISLNANPDSFLDKSMCGFCANGDFSSLKNFLIRVTENKKLQEELGENSFNYFKKHHDIRRNVRKLVKLFK